MADLNRDMIEFQKRFSRISTELKTLLVDYDSMFRDINRMYMDERLASGSTAGLEDFYRLLQTLRRNRDIIGSVVRGCSGYRPIDKFKFIEEDIPEEKVKKPRKKAHTEKPPEQPPPLEDVEEHIEELV